MTTTMSVVEGNTMSTIKTFPTTTFTVDQQERLESILISMLYSGTISEEVAMELNTRTTAASLFRGLNDCRAVGEINVRHALHLVQIVVENKYPELTKDIDYNADLSEFFECHTPEEAKNLQSWAVAFGIKIKLNVNSDLMTNSLNSAWKKSGMNPHAFLDYLKNTRSIFDISGLSFHVFTYGSITRFYFVENAWYCEF